MFTTCNYLVYGTEGQGGDDIVVGAARTVVLGVETLRCSDYICNACEIGYTFAHVVIFTLFCFLDSEVKVYFA